MHFSVKTTGVLLALLSISGSWAVPVGDGSHSVARRSKCTKVKSNGAGTSSIASADTNPPPEDTLGEDASGIVTIPNPAEANPGDVVTASDDTLTPPKGTNETDVPPAAGQPDSSLNLSSDDVAKKTQWKTDSSDGAPAGDDAPSDDKSVPEGQSQDAAVPEVESNADTHSDTPTSTDQTGDGGSPEPSKDAGVASKGADAGETVQVLGLSSNSVTSSKEAKAENSNSNPGGNNKATSGVGKAGLGWNNDSGKRWDQFTGLQGTQVGWSYNWASGKNEKGNHPEGINYVPMLHGKAIPGVEDKPALFETNKAKFKDWGVTHILSFNEPDMPIGDVGGSAMTVEEAVALHQKHLTPLATQFKIGGPAYSQGKLDDLKKWETQCAGKCAFDFVSLHFYGTDVKSLKGYLDEAATKFPGKPLWMTEIGCISYGNPTKYCSDDEVKAFMNDAIPLLRERTERYAWQGSFDRFPKAPADRNNMMEPGSFEINEKGKIFATTV